MPRVLAKQIEQVRENEVLENINIYGASKEQQTEEVRSERSR